MATLSVKTLASDCLDKGAPLSVRRDVLGVYATDNPQVRSVKDRLDLIQNMPFVRIALVTIQGAASTLQRDLDNTNTVLQNECDIWLYPVDSITVDRPDLLILNQNSCPLGEQANPTDEEDELFDLGREFGTDLVAYYIQNGPNAVGCSAYPAGRRGFWVDDGASPWTFPHELVHVMGLNPTSPIRTTSCPPLQPPSRIHRRISLPANAATFPATRQSRVAKETVMNRVPQALQEALESDCGHSLESVIKGEAPRISRRCWRLSIDPRIPRSA